LVVGCDNKRNSKVTIPPSPTISINALQIISSIEENNIDTKYLITPDSKYIFPKKEWIETDFSEGLKSFQDEIGISSWASESNDCDKFAITTSFYAKWLNHLSPNRNLNASIACGEVYYNKSGSGPHAINFFLVFENEKLKVLFYEPQVRSIISLNSDEIKSIFFLKL
jgi:hypothetical protein